MPKIIVIGQQQRCGGSLIVRLFDGHEQVAVHPHENYCGRPYKYHLPLFDINASPEKVWESVFEPPMIQISKSKKCQGYPIKYDFLNHKHLFLKNYPYDDATYQSIYLHYLDTLFESIFEESIPSNPEYYLYFTPRHVLYSEEILETFKGSHVIQLIRNPLGFLNSVKSHNRFYDMVSAKFIWRLFFFNSLYCLKKQLTGYHLLIFEDLLKEPELYLRSLCFELEIDYDENLLIPTFGKFKWKGNSHFRKLNGIDRSVTGHHKIYLDSEEINFFDNEVALFESLKEKMYSKQDIAYWDEKEIEEGLKIFEAFLPIYKRDKPVNTKAYVFSPEGQKLYDSLLGSHKKYNAPVFCTISDIDERKTLISCGEMLDDYNSGKIPPLSINKDLIKTYDVELFAQFFIGLVNVYGSKTAGIFISKHPNSDKLSKTIDTAIQLYMRDPRGISLRFLAVLCRVIFKKNKLRKFKSFYLILLLLLTWLKSLRLRLLFRSYSEL